MDSPLAWRRPRGNQTGLPDRLEQPGLGGHHRSLLSPARTRDPPTSNLPGGATSEPSWPAERASRPPTARTRGPRGLACGYCVSPCGSRTARDLAGPCAAPVIHFSTATFVHSCGEADQRVYLNHPQAYPQDVSLTRPRAGVIGASSHAGPGFFCAHSGQRRPGPDRTWIMPRTHSSTIRVVSAFRSMPEPPSSCSRCGAARERDNHDRSLLTRDQPPFGSFYDAWCA